MKNGIIVLTKLGNRSTMSLLRAVENKAHP